MPPIFEHPAEVGSFHRRMTWHRLSIPSNMQVFSMGMYCFVIILIISWATIPPTAAEMLCSSPPAARATSPAASAMRALWAMPGTRSFMEATISLAGSVSACEVALKAK